MKNFNYVVGVDEVGMGPLAGPVISCACILKKKIKGVKDSKNTTEKERIELVPKIKENSIGIEIGQASVKEIDKLNIHHASLLSKKRAVEKLFKKIKLRKKDKVLILTDGKFIISNLKLICTVEQKAIVKGDTKIHAISAASIVAKVYRDELMKKLHRQFPEYDFDKHKGYPTKLHYEKLKIHGPTKHHRKTFLKKLRS